MPRHRRSFPLIEFLPVVILAMSLLTIRPIRSMVLPYIMRKLLVIAVVLIPFLASSGTIFSDSFSTSSLNSLSPAPPAPTATAYQLFSSKTWNPSPAIGANGLRFGIGATTSGHIEAHALFSAVPVQLATAGDSVEILITFTNTSGLFTQSGQFGFGLYNSGGIAPLAGGMNASAVSGTANVTGGAQGWQGYLTRIAYNGGSHRIATRPAQAITTGNNQDLITEGSGSQSYAGGVNLASSASTFSQAAGSELTASLRITLTAASTLQIESKLYSGDSPGGTLLLSQIASASGASFLTAGFDAFCIGWRDTGNSSPTLIDITTITVASSLPGGPGNDVAGLYFQQSPSDAVAGTTISPAVTIVATNAAGNPVTNAVVNLSLLSGSGPVNGTLGKVTDAGGVATFDDMSLSASGPKQLRATSGAATADSVVFNISSAPAAELVFTTQPTSAGIAAIIAPPVVVQLRDTYGNNAASNATITLTLSSGTGTINGNAIVATDTTGQSTFTNLSINLAGTKQLTAAKPGLPNTASSPFNITNLIVAFPGAEGAGANAVGGRGGDVYYVNTLTDNNSSGSLRYGISTAPAGGRTICFKVSGNIVLNSTLTVNKSRITVAGQTAPGDGICFQNYSFNIAANDVIVRHLRSRLGTNAMQEADCMWINAGTNIIVDHVSASWSVDEVLSSSTDVANLTVQNCFITESLNNSIHEKGAHGYGGIISASADTTYSYLRNLYAHNQSRNPRIGSDAQAGTLRLDFRNNVIYNYGGRAGYTGATNESCEANYVGNYCIKGPSSTYNYILQGGGSTTHVYQNGNYIDLNLNGLVDGANTGWSMFSQSYTPFVTPFDVPAATTETAPVAYQRVVALSGAMPWRRDTTDQRIAQTVRQQNGMIIDAVAQVGTWPTLAAEPAPLDTDNDGMPNYWELAVGLNPNNAADRNNIDDSGYTELEVYLNWLADAHALCDRNGQVDVDLRTATGGATNLTYSVSSGINGTVSLLGNGYTARFIAAANTNGAAHFTFTATGNGTLFGPINYGILITTTNAPISNTAPTLDPIPDQNVIAGATINFTNSATDTDTPAQALTFSLQDGPTGASVNSINGIFNWRPTIAQSPTTNLMNVIVTDNGTPSMSSTQGFTITVTRPAQPDLSSVSITGGAFRFQVSGDAGPDYHVQASTNLADWSSIFTTNSPPVPFNWSDPATGSFNQRFYRVILGP